MHGQQWVVLSDATATGQIHRAVSVSPLEHNLLVFPQAAGLSGQDQWLGFSGKGNEPTAHRLAFSEHCKLNRGRPSLSRMFSGWLSHRDTVRHFGVVQPSHFTHSGRRLPSASYLLSNNTRFPNSPPLTPSTGWPLAWKTGKSQGIAKWSGKSQWKWRKVRETHINSFCRPLTAKTFSNEMKF